jgi:hypothetical protein
VLPFACTMSRQEEAGEIGKRSDYVLPVLVVRHITVLEQSTVRSTCVNIFLGGPPY